MKSPYIPILCYHRVCPKSERGTDSPSLCVSPEQFSLQMSLLKWLGYQTITPQHLVAYLDHRKNMHKKAVLITFDDGYKDNYTYALPILKKNNFTATIFLVTDHIGGKNRWDSGTIPLLNEKEIIEMQNEGIIFGSHTANHLDMSSSFSLYSSPSMGEDKGGGVKAINRELEQSKKKLESLTSRLDIPFCYPYSRLSAESKEMVKQNGYLCAFAGDGGKDDDIFELRRIQVFPSTSLFGFWKKLQSWYPEFVRFQKRLKGKKE